MNTFLIALFGTIAALWGIQALRAGRGMLGLPRLEDVKPAEDAACPKVSILFSARDEEEKIRDGLRTLVALEYPHYEIIAVDDRSKDATGRILDEFARQHSMLKVVRLNELPSGWLGKPHGLQKGYEQSTGEWLVFTDADVRFAPDLLRLAVALVEKNQWEHMTLLGNVDMVGFWEKTLLTYFMINLTMYAETWRVSDPKTKSYMGVGAFQMMRRATYEAIGTHRRLAMEVIDDMKLGKLVKQGGFRSGVAVAKERIAVRWHAGLANIIGGTTKNFFAGADYSLPRAVGQIAAILVFQVLPFAALAMTSGIPLLLAAITALLSVLLQGAAARESDVSPLYGFTYPIAAMIFAYMVARSMAVTLWRGGIVWRGTFYPLEELRKGLV